MQTLGKKAPVSSKKNGKRGFPFRAVFQVLVFSGLVGLTVFALRPVHRAIQDGIRHIRDDLIGRVEDAVGRRIRYASISPSILGAFDIRSVRILGKDENSADLLSVSRIRVSYSFLDLIRNARGGARSIRSIFIDRPRIELDTVWDRDLIDFLFPAADSPVSRSGLAELLPERALVSIRDGRCLIQNRRDLFRLEGVNLDARTTDKRISLDGRCVVSVSGVVFGESLGARINARISGDCGADLGEGRATIFIASVTGDRFRARSLAFDCTLRDQKLSLQKLNDQMPFDFSLDYGIAGGGLAAWLACDGFTPVDLLTLSGTWKTGNRWLSLAYSGAVSFEYGAGGILGYRIDLAGERPLEEPAAPSLAVVVPAALSSEAAPDPSSEAMPSHNGSFMIRAAGDENLARIEEFRLSAPYPAGQGLFQGNAGFRGTIGLRPFAPNGALSLENLSLTGDAGLSAGLSVSTRGREIRLAGKTVTIAAGTAPEGRPVLALNGLDISLVSSGGDLDFVVSARRPGDGDSYHGRKDGFFSLEGALNYAPQRLEASLLLDSFSAGDLVDMARPFVREPRLPAVTGDILRNVTVNTEIFFSTDFRKLLYNAPRVEMALDPLSPGGGPSGVISLSGTDKRFELSESRLVWGENTALISGRADYSNPMDVVFSVTANYRDISYHAEGRLLDRNQLSVSGSHGFRAYIAPGGAGAWSGHIEGKEIPVSIRGLPAHLNMYAELGYYSADFWSLELDTFEVTDIAGPAGPGYLHVTGGVNQSGAHFPLIYYRDNIGPLTGRVDASWRKTPVGGKNGTPDTAYFAGFEGTLSMEEAQDSLPISGGGESFVRGFPLERYAAGVSFADGNLNLSFSGSRMRLDRVFAGTSNATADGKFTVTWNREQSYRADLSLDSLSARFQGREFGASARAALDRDAFSIQDLRVTFAGIEGFMPLLRVSRAEGRAETGADFRGDIGKGRLEGSLTANVAFAPAASWMSINSAFRSFEGLVRVEQIRYADVGSSGPFDIVFSRNDGNFLVQGGPQNMLRLRLDQDGTFYAGLSGPFPIRGSFSGMVDKNTIDARCPDLYVDLAGLWRLLPPVPGFVLAGGYVSAELDIRGPLTDPEFFGFAKGTSVSIQVPHYVTRDIRPVPFTVVIEGNEMRFGPVPAMVGAGAGSVTGEFRFDRWIPNVFTINIAVPRATPIPFGFNLTGFLATGDISGKLRLSMADAVFDITGDLLANNTEISLNTDEIARVRDSDIFAGAAHPVTLDMKITTGPTVEFLWPNSNFPILRANPAMGTVVRVTTNTVARQFSLTSDVKIRGGEIFYFERSFYIRSGSLSFKENESQFDPRLTVRAEIRDRSENGPVIISMVVDNAPLLTFTPRFESNPSLSQTEIVSLLGQSLTGSPADESTGQVGSMQRALLSSTSDFLAQFGVVRRLERQIRDFLRLDMFSIRTHVLQNAFFSATGLGQDPVDRNGQVGNYFDNTTVFLGKYIGPDMFIQSMLSLRYDENQITAGGLRFEPEIGVELQNPLFSIRWDFVPAHPENWYVNDNSVTLTWRKSF
jgi:hypothetical protein